MLPDKCMLPATPNNWGKTQSTELKKLTSSVHKFATRMHSQCTLHTVNFNVILIVGREIDNKISYKWGPRKI